VCVCVCVCVCVSSTFSVTFTALELIKGKGRSIHFPDLYYEQFRMVPPTGETAESLDCLRLLSRGVRLVLQ